MTAMIVAALSSSGCAAAGGETATWALADPSAVSAQSDRIDLLVSRLECASGVTGETLPPVVSYSAEEVAVRVDVKANGNAAANCQGNDLVPVSVELREPLGERNLVDGACMEGDATKTVFCEDGGVRFSGQS
ncbi:MULTISPECIES: hypothetical protein [unclassified Rathayibacter]|uniref:hypothetical protein n=1 Tax=unclassified Rathayibacter TaxID=2609250 RepID=UPI0014050BB5|nr:MULTISPECIES: hypothetical protein [unclassified Rathayibacter]